MSGAQAIRRPDAFDASAPDFQRDPYPTYAFMREHAPVHTGTGVDGEVLSFAFRHADVVEVLRSPDFETTGIASDALVPFLEQPDSPLHALARIISSMMLVKDGEDHRRLRGLVNQAFTPRMVEALRPRVEAIVDELLAASAARGGLDAIADLGAPLPVIVIAELLGMPPRDRERLRGWSNRLATFIDGTIRERGVAEAAAAATELCAYMQEIIGRRRRESRDDLISALVAAREQEDRLSENELLGTIALILGAGHETTTNLLGNGLWALLRHPDQLAWLRRSPERIAGAVEELLRFDSPVQLTSRVPVREVELSGVRVPAGRELNLYLGAANRDPALFRDPDALDLSRDEGRHLSFGHGAHFCLGAALARLEAQVAIGALLERFPNWKAAGEDPPRRPGIVLRGLTSLPLRF